MTAPASPAPAALAPAYGPPISLDQAKAVMAAAEAEARANGWPMVIAIFDSGANLVMLERMDNTQLGSIQIAQGKAATAVKFRRPTKAFQDQIAAGGQNLRVLAMEDVTPLEGGMPLTQNGLIIGAIGVSGMTSAQDAQVGEAGARALMV